LSLLENLKKTSEDIESMPESPKERLMKHLSLLNTTVNNRCEESGFIKIAPKKDGRIVCTGERL